MRRRHFHALAGAGLLAAAQLGLPGLAQAQDSGTLRVWVGFPPGGSVDTVARIVAEKMRGTLNQNVIVEGVIKQMTQRHQKTRSLLKS